MTKPNTPRAQAREARNKAIVAMVDSGMTRHATAKAMDLTYAVVACVVCRAQAKARAGDVPAVIVRGESSTERARRATALTRAGIFTAKGSMYEVDREKFDALVAKAAPEVKRVTGESNERGNEAGSK